MSKLSPTELPMKLNETIDKLNIDQSINLIANDQYRAIKAIEKPKDPRPPTAGARPAPVSVEVAEGGDEYAEFERY